MKKSKIKDFKSAKKQFLCSLLPIKIKSKMKNKEQKRPFKTKFQKVLYKENNLIT